MIPPAKLNKSKVLTRVQILFSLAIILPITIAAFFSYFQIKNSLAEQAHERLHLASKYHANVMIEHLITTESLLRTLEPLPEIEAGKLTNMQKDLKSRTVFIAAANNEGNPQTNSRTKQETIHDTKHQDQEQDKEEEDEGNMKPLISHLL